MKVCMVSVAQKDVCCSESRKLEYKSNKRSLVLIRSPPFGKRRQTTESLPRNVLYRKSFRIGDLNCIPIQLLLNGYGIKRKRI